MAVPACRQAADREKIRLLCCTAMPAHEAQARAQVSQERAYSSSVAKTLLGGWETCSSQRLVLARAPLTQPSAVWAGSKAEVQHTGGSSTSKRTYKLSID